MTLSKFSRICVSSLLGVITLAVMDLPLLAQVSSSLQDLIYKHPLPPPTDPVPRTTPGSSRGPCQADVLPKVLMPKADPPGDYKWANTSQERPTLLFWLPYDEMQIQSAKLVVRSYPSRERLPQERELTMFPQSAGTIVSTQIPPNLSLEAGQSYLMSLSLDVICKPKASAQTVEISGIIHRVTPQNLPNLTSTTPQQQAIAYAQKGLWLDALSALIPLKASNPQDPFWQTLMAQGGWEEAIVNAPLMSPQSQFPTNTNGAQ